MSADQSRDPGIIARAEARSEAVGAGLRMEDFSFALDQKGHDCWFEHFRPLELVMCLDEADGKPDPIALDAIAEAWKTNTALVTPIPFSVPWFAHQTCQYCKAGDFFTDGFTITAKDECPYPKGFEVVSVQISIPSGRIFFRDDLRDYFPAEKDDYYVNAAHGIRDTVLEYEKASMAHFFVGNSCPGIYRQAKDDFLIANPAWVEHEDPTKDGYEEDSSVPGESVGGVCTDLWWVSIVDGGEAEQRGVTADEIDGEAEVTPGIYQLDYYGLAKSFDRDGKDGKPVIYARFYRNEKGDTNA